jgi:hypothetical protein
MYVQALNFRATLDSFMKLTLISFISHDLKFRWKERYHYSTASLSRSCVTLMEVTEPNDIKNGVCYHN